MTRLEFEEWLRDCRRRPLIMGVLNVTPDSFSDGGRFSDVAAAVEQAHRMAAAGASIIDIGGESTRPGSARVAADEQIRRVLPVLRELGGRLPALISIDTTLAAVAGVAIDHGAQIINDISAGLDDAEMLPLAAEAGVAIVLMHMQGQPATMQVNPSYENVVKEVREHLVDRAQAAERAGILRHRILLDPGIGFGKTLEHNLSLLRELEILKQLDHPLVLGVSRKGFIGRLAGESDPAERIFGTAAAVAWCTAHGADVLRVHDVEAMGKVVRVTHALRTGEVLP